MENEAKKELTLLQRLKKWFKKAKDWIATYLTWVNFVKTPAGQTTARMISRVTQLSPEGLKTAQKAAVCIGSPFLVLEVSHFLTFSVMAIAVLFFFGVVEINEERLEEIFESVANFYKETIDAAWSALTRHSSTTPNKAVGDTT